MALPDTEIYAHVDGDSRTTLLDHHREVSHRARRLGSRVGDGITTSVPFADLVSVAGYTHDIAKATGAFQRYLHDIRANSPHVHAVPGALVTATVCDAMGYEGADLLVPTFAVARHHTPFPRSDTPLEYVHSIVLEYQQGSNKSREYADIVEAIDHEPASKTVANELCRRASSDTIGWTAVRDSLLGSSHDALTGSVYEVLESEIESSAGASVDRSVLSMEFYGDLLAAWSTLVSADKTAAAGIPLERVTPIETAGGTTDHSEETRPQAEIDSDPVGLPTSVLERHIGELGTGTKLDDIRDEAHATVMSALESIGDLSEPRVYTIQLATGLGKTATGVHAAMRLRDATDTPVSVVYALPYTSIIDQTAETIGEVYDVDPTDPSFTSHHHLQPTVSRFEETDSDADEGTRDRRERVRRETTIAKTWQADLTITTFVQLFESVLNPASSQLMKLPTLAGGVIVLDEPQALPPVQWELLRDALCVLVDRFGCRVVLMTATQPTLFGAAPDIEPRPLVTSEQSRSFHERDAVQRVEYRFHESVPLQGGVSETPLGYEQAAKTLVREANAGDRTMAICNTVASAGALSDALAAHVKSLSGESKTTDPTHISINEVDDDCIETVAPSSETLERELRTRIDRVIADSTSPTDRSDTGLVSDDDVPAVVVTGHLTARHRPIDRRRLLSVLDSFEHPKATVVLIATQVVEAGVDISFDRVYRDYAPLPNVVQAAGRCNREFERDLGVVTVWQLASVSTGEDDGAETTGDDGRQDVPGTHIYKTGRVADFLSETTAVLSKTVYRSDDDGRSSAITARAPSPVVAHDAVKAYYDRLERKGIAQMKETKISECATGELRSYQLINDYGVPVDVFVCRSSADRQTVEQLRAAVDNHEWFDFDRLLRESADRRISTSRAASESSALETAATRLGETSIYVADRDSLVSDFFDPVTGLSLDGTDDRGEGTGVDRLLL